ncbi:MAG: hypothetical protein MUO62_07545 [Anaerolineales bacterium]|nr:hypothetical protein [Anaerolineales bacterium]
MATERKERAIRTTFIMEQHIGHQSYYPNLRKHIDQQAQVHASWVEVTYERAGFLWQWLKLLTLQFRGALAGATQVLQGLIQNPYDIEVYNTQVPAALTLGLANRKPAVLCLDITPIQYGRMTAILLEILQNE